MLKTLSLKRMQKLSFLTISLCGCTHFPEMHPHLISVKDGKCVEYQVESQTDACNIVYSLKQEWPLEHCDLFTALPPEDIAALKVYQKKVCVEPAQ